MLILSCFFHFKILISFAALLRFTQVRIPRVRYEFLIMSRAVTFLRTWSTVLGSLEVQTAILWLSNERITTEDVVHCENRTARWSFWWRNSWSMWSKFIFLEKLKELRNISSDGCKCDEVWTRSPQNMLPLHVLQHATSQDCQFQEVQTSDSREKRSKRNKFQSGVQFLFASELTFVKLNVLFVSVESPRFKAYDLILWIAGNTCIRNG